MKNLRRKYPQVPEKARCRCNLIHERQTEKYLQVMKRERCRYIGLKKSICNNEYQGIADTMVAIKASVQANWQILGQMRSRRQINLYEKIKVYPHHFCKSKMMRIFKIKINGYNKWLVQYPRVLIRRWLRVF